jgi:hypothetical protein
MGTAHLLFPPGCDDIRELPAPLFEAIKVSLIYLGFEEMPLEDQPPKKIWQDNDALKQHFEMLKQKRKQEASTTVEGPIEDPVQNELAKDMIVQ